MTDKIIEQSFGQYAAAVAQSRALVDVRDGLKPSLRMVMYFHQDDKYVYPKKEVACQKLLGSGYRGYIHGDTAMYETFARAAKKYAMHYPLYDWEGNYGTLVSQRTPASRYTGARVSQIGKTMFNGIDENAITDWRDNYDNTEKYPSVLPSLGFWGLINGTSGIAVGLASSVPQFNLKEMNTALIECLWDRPFNIPMPDFATGGILTNKSEVEEALSKGQGASVRLRAKMEYDIKENCILVTELPYATYTDIICEQLEKLIDAGTITEFIDNTGDEAQIKIYFPKSSTPDQVIHMLYKETSLENFYGINMTMLHEGKYPKVFTLPEAMKAHLEHEQKCYTNIYNSRLKTAQDRLHIVEGYIIACANIEEVIKVIKASKSSSDAQTNLTKNFTLTMTQAAAVLKLTLSRIAALEVQKFEKEKNELLTEIGRIQSILNDVNLLKKEIEKGLREVMTKFGDARRTKILDVSDENTSRLLYFTKTGKVYLNKPKNEIVMNTILSDTPYLAVTRKGIVYRSNDIPASARTVFSIDKDDEIIAIQPAFEQDFLVVYTQEKNFRCTPITSLNKKKTTLSLNNITDVYISNTRITKSEYRKK